MPQFPGSASAKLPRGANAIGCAVLGLLGFVVLVILGLPSFAGGGQTSGGSVDQRLERIEARLEELADRESLDSVEAGVGRALETSGRVEEAVVDIRRSLALILAQQASAGTSRPSQVPAHSGDAAATPRTPAVEQPELRAQLTIDGVRVEIAQVSRSSNRIEVELGITRLERDCEISVRAPSRTGTLLTLVGGEVLTRGRVEGGGESRRNYLRLPVYANAPTKFTVSFDSTVQTPTVASVLSIALSAERGRWEEKFSFRDVPIP